MSAFVTHIKHAGSPTGLSLLLTIICFLPLLCQAQWVKEDDTSRIWMADGVYLSEQDFFENKPKGKWVILGVSDWRYRDSIQRKGVLVEVSSREIIRSNLDIRSHQLLCDTGTGRVTIDLRAVWGLCVHGIPYQHIKSESRQNFIRFRISGRVSFLQYTREYDDYFNLTPNLMGEDRQLQTEVIDVIVDFDEQRIIRNTRSNLEVILERDTELYEQYQLEKKKSRAIDNYIRRYNKRYPLDF